MRVSSANRDCPASGWLSHRGMRIAHCLLLCRTDLLLFFGLQPHIRVIVVFLEGRQARVVETDAKIGRLENGRPAMLHKRQTNRMVHTLSTCRRTAGKHRVPMPDHCSSGGRGREDLARPQAKKKTRQITTPVLPPGHSGSDSASPSGQMSMHTLACFDSVIIASLPWQEINQK